MYVAIHGDNHCSLGRSRGFALLEEQSGSWTAWSIHHELLDQPH